MLVLAERLRLLYQKGAISGVDMIIPDDLASGPQQAYEVAMGANVSVVQAAHPQSITIAYSGNAHARKAPLDIGVEHLVFAAGTLRQPVISVVLRSGPGSAWTCVEHSCGPHIYEARGDNVRGLSNVEVPQGYDEIVYTGTPTTASPPADPPTTR